MRGPQSTLFGAPVCPVHMQDRQRRAHRDTRSVSDSAVPWNTSSTMLSSARRPSRLRTNRSARCAGDVAGAGIVRGSSGPASGSCSHMRQLSLIHKWEPAKSCIRGSLAEVPILIRDVSVAQHLAATEGAAQIVEARKQLPHCSTSCSGSHMDRGSGGS